MDTKTLDRAIKFAVDAHAGAERRGKGFPYIVHPIEAVAVTATMTKDQDLLAAAALHDVVEDTDITTEEIEREFGKKIADLVAGESDKFIEGVSDEDTWHDRKQMAIDRIKAQSRDGKIVAMGDKLSNMRAIYRDYNEIGNELWNRFHTKDPLDHEWHYRGLADSLSELGDTEAYKEFVGLIDKVFGSIKHPFSFTEEGNTLYITGMIDGANADKIVSAMGKGRDYLLDLSKADGIDFAGQRSLFHARKGGLFFSISNAPVNIAEALDSSGVSKFISVCKKPVDYDINSCEIFGGGFTAESFNNFDNDSMMKLYFDFIEQSAVEKEKRYAQTAFMVGIPTPMSGELIQVGNRKGVVFERVMNKKSMSRAIADDPEHVEKYAGQFADMCLNLHKTPCDKAIFPSTAEAYRKSVMDSKVCDDKEKKAIIDFLGSVEDTGVCNHGDLHMGNVLLTGKDSLFIDMGDFGYGNPLFDLGMVYYVSHCISPEMTDDLYHNTIDTMHAFWKYFSKYYFGADTADEQTMAELKVQPFAGLKALQFMNRTGPIDEGLKQVKEFLLDRI
jgi:uncharacterized protein (TIGR02172 family)